MGKLEERVAGMMKEMDAKLAGAKDEVKVTLAGTIAALPQSSSSSRMLGVARA